MPHKRCEFDASVHDNPIKSVYHIEGSVLYDILDPFLLLLDLLLNLRRILRGILG